MSREPALVVLGAVVLLYAPASQGLARDARANDPSPAPAVDDYYVIVPEGEACPPEVVPEGTIVVICAPLPLTYQIPQPPDYPRDAMDGYYVLFPSIVPDDGAICPLPQELGGSVLAVMCGPWTAGLGLPPPPHYDGALCAQAEEQLQAMKSMFAAAVPPDQVATRFPDYAPASCIAAFSLDGQVVVSWDAIDPALDVPRVVIQVDQPDVASPRRPSDAMSPEDEDAVTECMGVPLTQKGGPGGETLYGTLGVDSIAGLGGDDTVLGYDATDFLCGNSGDDIISGDAGSDVVNGWSAGGL